MITTTTITTTTTTTSQLADAKMEIRRLSKSNQELKTEIARLSRTISEQCARPPPCAGLAPHSARVSSRAGWGVVLICLDQFTSSSLTHTNPLPCTRTGRRVTIFQHRACRERFPSSEAHNPEPDTNACIHAHANTCVSITDPQCRSFPRVQSLTHAYVCHHHHHRHHQEAIFHTETITTVITYTIDQPQRR